MITIIFFVEFSVCMYVILHNLSGDLGFRIDSDDISL